MPDHPCVLVATLGGQPQIVTFTLDLLLRKGFPISEVIVLHPKASASSRLYRALVCLNAEFSKGSYPSAQRAIHFHSQALELDGQPIEDITDDTHADGTLNTIHQLLSDLKQQGCRIHLSVSGGRRLMGLLAISVATLNFDRNDYIWHLSTPEGIRKQANEGQLMHVSPDAGLTLIRGPFLSLGPYISNSNPTQPFRSAQETQRAQMDAQEHAHCAFVVQEAKPAPLKVLRAFARGLRPQQVANELVITTATVNSHKTAILSLCHIAWNIPEEERLDYHFLYNKFRTYFQPDE
jgi:CRISPR-associated Csx14 family protein